MKVQVKSEGSAGVGQSSGRGVGGGLPGRESRGWRKLGNILGIEKASVAAEK